MNYRAPEELFGLTPVQSGMLFHSLSDPASGAYVVQLHVEIFGPLDAARLRGAWERAVARHPVLRTAFLWEGLDQPLQAVRDRVEVPWEQLDWSECPEDGRGDLLARLLDEERTRGFDLAQAPLLRLKLVRLATDRHVLLWTVHHLIVDGWSTVILTDEIFSEDLSLQATADTVEVADRHEPPPPFKAFVDWLARRDHEADRVFWSSTLAAHERAAPLAVERRVPGPGARLDRRSRSLGTERTAELREWARNHRLTLATAMHGAWAQVLRRYADGGAFTYGAVLSGRPPDLPGVERMVGPFITTVPVPIAPAADDASLLDWLRGLQNTLSGLRPFEHCAPLDIVDERPPHTERTLFDSVLVFENAPSSGIQDGGAAGGLSLGPIQYRDQSHYDLALLVMPGEDLVLTAIHRTARLPAQAVDVMLDHVESVLDSMLRSPDEPLGQHAPPLGPERSRIVTELQPSGYDGPVPDLAEFDVVERFRRWASAEPGRLAVFGDARAWSYDELDRRSDALASRLRQERETGNGVRVALLAGRTPELIAGVLGILKTGSAYVPLDPSYPVARLRYMLEAAGSTRLVVAPEQREHPLALEAPRMTLIDRRLEDAPPLASVQPAVRAAVQPDDLAYVIFTSGSTGRPKPVGITRRNIAYSTWARGPVYGEAPERFLLVSPSAFDSSKVGLFWPLCTGGALVLAPDGQERDPDALFATLRQHEITHVLYVPVIHQWILERCSAGSLPALRSVIVAGEDVAPALAPRHFEVLPQVHLFNEYGPTEATVWASVYRFPWTVAETSGSPPTLVGRPIPGTALRVLDADGLPAPTLVSGEIYIDGPGVAPGYLGNPEATSDAFVSRGAGASRSVLYRTGDLGRFHPDGNLEFMGRVDRQVKIRGHRVELGEIENVVSSHPAVSAAAVTLVDAGDGARQLVAWVVAPDFDAGKTGDAAGAVRAHVGDSLPGPMVPDRVEFIQALPRSPNGKIDRDQLSREPLSDPPQTLASPPETETERRLVGLWCEVLGIGGVGTRESFFSVGGHSLLAVRLLGRIREEFRVDLSMDAIFEHPTVHALGARLDAGSTSQPTGGRETFEF